MPAVVVPKIQLEIATRARHTGIWFAACADCKWFPDPYFVEEVAKQDGYQHNLLRHDGAGVEFLPGDPMEQAEGHEQWLTKIIRKGHGILLLTIVSYAFMIGWVLGGGPILALCFILYGGIVYQQSRSIGKWFQRREEQRGEIGQMQGGNQVNIEIEPPETND